MKPDTLITCTDRRYLNWQGYVSKEHPNLKGFYWCRLSETAPFPAPYGTKLKHHVDKVLPLSQLTEIKKP